MESCCRGPGILESDCATVVTALHAKVKNMSTLWSVLSEAQAIMQGRPDVEVRKINWSSNKVAHNLAQLGKSECGVLDEAGPSCVAALLFEDCINLVCLV